MVHDYNRLNLNYYSSTCNYGLLSYIIRIATNNAYFKKADNSLSGVDQSISMSVSLIR